MKISYGLDLSSSDHLKLVGKLLKSENAEKEESTFEGTKDKKKNPQEAICYSFALDPTSPSYLKVKDKIFNVNADEDIGYFSKTFLESTTDYTECEQIASKNVAAEFGLDADLHQVFSGSVSMKMRENSDSNIKTLRLDAECLACIALVSPIGVFNSFPERKLNDSFKEAVNLLECEKVDESQPIKEGEDSVPDDKTAESRPCACEEFASKIGIFYATDLHLGGRVRKSYIMQATEDDNEFSVRAEIEAKFGAGSFGTIAGNEKTSGYFIKRDNSAKSSMKTEWRIQGGNTAMLLGLTSRSSNDVDANSLIEKWAKTVKESNCHPINMTLRPIWELVEKLDAPENKTKAQKLKKHLKKKWAETANYASNLTHVLPILIRQQKKLKEEIVKKIEEHKRYLKFEKEDAEDWITTWHAIADIIRNLRWRAAAVEGLKVMDEILDKLEDKSKRAPTAREFEEYLRKLRKEFRSKSDRYDACCGRISYHSNKINKKNIECLSEIIQVSTTVIESHGSMDTVN